MAVVESVNVGVARAIGARSGLTGIDKRPVDGAVRVEEPGPAQSGLAGDDICDAHFHRPGTYLRVLEPGPVRAGDTVDVVHRPAHGVTVQTVFRAFTAERELLAGLLAVDGEQADVRNHAERRAGVHT
ncbi:hypothetical protein [Pseudonocardia sp. N23]|uniref:hypothetical protein n=1 Tax=Pseudonocardia sp. N23 TaxID=1987376 RepID=UPI000BFC56CC|nr:hypothetical protein [Pseudonocardia sp. N23]GAY10280.1 uncharacterized protein conserved in bacteria [Pseudonocardia sp. N23]